MVKKYEWYPADDAKKTLKRHTPKAPKLRSGIAPGSVLILLAGRFRGKRVVFLKQLKSGLLAVTGPYKVNGVPVKRVNQAYTITTSAKVDVSGVKAEITDETFKKEKAKKSSRSQKFFVQKGMSTLPSIFLYIKIMLAKYLSAGFSLVKGDSPHAMKF